MRRAPELTTERLALRRFTPADLNWLAELYSDRDVTRYLGGVMDRANVEERLNTRILQYYDEHPWPLGDMNEMAITWIFEYEGERSYVQRQDGLDRITVLTWSNLDQDAMIVHTELEAVQLVQALQQELESRGWALIACCPERRQGGERRIAQRSSLERRRHGL